MRVFGRHAAGGVGRADALVKAAFGGFAGDDRLERGFLAVEAEIGHARRRVGTVALEAVFSEDGADITLEVHAGGVEQRRGEDRGEFQIPHNFID